VNAGPSWAELWANFGLFRDAILAGGLAGALLGFIGVHVVLRRMVFASSAIAQAAALGVALAFWMPNLIDPTGHAALHQAGGPEHALPSLLFEPVVWAMAASLLATLVFMANPLRLHLTRESVLGFVFIASSAGAVIIGDKITQEAIWPPSCSAGPWSCTRSTCGWWWERRWSCSPATSSCGGRWCS
jgi:ABC-type Mn2+/Zn2+ transport system permease subunit